MRHFDAEGLTCSLGRLLKAFGHAGHVTGELEPSEHRAEALAALLRARDLAVVALLKAR